MRLAERVQSRDNVFDVLRLVGAFLVLISHSWALAGRVEPGFAGDSLGGLGVTIFFAISGFLVARSWHLDPRVSAFVVKRVLRLWPAFLAVLLLTAVVLGAVLTDQSTGAYFASGDTARYAVRNAGLHIVYTLPGVFERNPYPNAVNGSLWTLPVEVKAYALLLVLGALGLLRRRIVLLAVLAFVIWMLVADAGTRPHVVATWLEGPLQTRLLAVFVGGALLYEMREHVRLDWRIAIAAAAAAWFAGKSGPGIRTATWSVAVPYLMVFLAYRGPAWLRSLVRPGDLSYGIYLWAFPVQQTVMVADGSLPPLGLLAIAAPITYALAFCSWRAIEAPALRLKQRVGVTSAVRPTPAVETA